MFATEKAAIDANARKLDNVHNNFRIWFLWYFVNYCFTPISWLSLIIKFKYHSNLKA